MIILLYLGHFIVKWIWETPMLTETGEIVTAFLIIFLLLFQLGKYVGEEYEREKHQIWKRRVE